MALRHEHDYVSGEHPERVRAEMTDETTSISEPFGVAQGAALVLGIFFAAIGMVGLARAGLDSLTTPSIDVAGMEMTPLLAMIHLGIGVVALIGTMSRGVARGVCMGLGPVLVVLGIVALVQPIEELGFDEMNGIVYLIAGAVAIVAALVTPLILHERRVTSL